MWPESDAATTSETSDDINKPDSQGIMYDSLSQY